jgi:hypothetical protein
VVKKGQLNLARVEGVGAAAAEIGEREGSDVLRVRLTDLTAEQGAKLREVLAEQARGFREAFGKGA